MKLAQIAVYPVKSCAGLWLAEAELGALGIVGDRRYALADAHGNVVTQRDVPRLSLVRCAARGGGLELSIDGQSVRIEGGSFGPATVELRVWGRAYTALAAPAATSAALSRALGSRLQLVRFDKPAERRGVPIAFADAAPVLVTNAATLAAVNRALSIPVAMERFRPNLVVEDAEAYAEDGWKVLEVGGARLRVLHACGRCEVTTVVPARGEFGPPEILQYLSTARAPEGEPVFGVYCAVERGAVLRAGDAVTPMA